MAWQKILKGSEEEMRQREGKRGGGEGEGRPAERRGGQSPFLCFSISPLLLPQVSGASRLPDPLSQGHHTLTFVML